MNQTLLSVLGAGTLLAAAAADLPERVVPAGVGVNIHFTRGHERDLDLIAAAGFKFIRMDFGWGGLERKPGEYRWTDYEELTANLEQRGLRAVYILDYSNSLYEDPITSRDPVSGKERRDTASPQKPDSVAAFARWAAAAAKHFQGRRIIWEIWNEPNIGFWKPKPDARQYTALALATVKAVRAADPQAIIVAPASSGFPWSFFEELFSSGILADLDAVSVHPYRNYTQGPETAAAEYLRLRGLIERHAPPEKKFMPILSGEWGYATHAKGGVTLETQAAFLARQQLANLWQGVPLSIWYDWKNDGTDTNYNEHNFGTVTHDLQPKPSYVAVRTLTRELGGYRIAQRLATPAEDFAFLLVNTNQAQKLAVWTTGAPREFSLPVEFSAAADVSAVDALGQPASVRQRDNGQLLCDLAAAPKYITLKRSSRRLSAAAALEFEGPVPTLVRAGGAPVRLPVKLRNPFGHPARVQLTGGNTQGGPMVVALAAGEEARRELRFQPDRVTTPLATTVCAAFEELSPAKTWVTLVQVCRSFDFILANPLPMVLAPVEQGLRVEVQNPAREPFQGTVQVGGQRLLLALAVNAASGSVHVPRPATAGPADAQLFDREGVPASARITSRFVPLELGAFKAVLDGDAKVPATATLTEEAAPGAEGRPWARAFRLSYRTEPGWRFVRCVPSGGKPVVVPTGAQGLGLWIFGDQSGQALRLRVTDEGGQTFQPNGPDLTWRGWRWMVFDLQNLKSAGHWGGANDGLPRGQLKLDCPLLLDSGSRKTEGTISFAGLHWILP